MTVFRIFLLKMALAAILVAPARVAAAPTSLLAAGTDAMKAAFDLADRGQLRPDRLADYSASPVYPWLRAADVRGRLPTAGKGEVSALLADFGDTLAGRWLREGWLQELARREDWVEFRSAWRDNEDRTLRCASLVARADAGSPDAAWITDARAAWLTGDPLPALCDRVFDRLSALGSLEAALRWQRIDLAVGRGQAGLIRHLAKALPREDAGLAAGYAAFLDKPIDALPAWPRTARSRAVLVAALISQARRDPGRAEALLERLGAAMALDAGQRGQVLHDIALWSAAGYLPSAAARLAAVPESSRDDPLYEWRVREAIARGDDAGALAAIMALPERLRRDSHWLYFQARLRERRGDPEAAGLYRQAAASANYFGWMAADRLRQGYSLCPQEPSRDNALRARVAADPALTRAFELFGMDRPELAVREWSAATKGMADDERRLAVQRALSEGWFDRAVFGMGGAPDDQRHYSLRFPLHHEGKLREQAGLNDLDPAWVAGQARAESSFMPRARSSADARGLLQLLPGTGEQMARRLGRPWEGGDSLFDPDTNLVLGTAYLRQMLDRYDGSPYLAIAAYNAGPAPVDRWRQQRSTLEPDFFVEAIPYKETREYVARVLAFSVVYDWRMTGSAMSLSERLTGRPAGAPSPRRAFSCPLPGSTGT